MEVLVDQNIPLTTNNGTETTPATLLVKLANVRAIN